MLAPLFAALALAVTLFAPAVLGDGDTYLHVAAGRWMLAHHAVPLRDPFSATFGGHTWVAHEWLSELALAVAFYAAGWAGVLVLCGVATASACYLLAQGLRQRLPNSMAALLCLAAGAAMAPSLLARPHILALPVMVAWTIVLLDAVEGSARPPWRLLPLMTLWANLHGGFVVGLALAGGLAIEAGCRGGRWPAWAGFLAAAVLAACVTPNGLDGLLLPFRLIAVSSLAQVDEWRPTDLTTPQPVDLLLLGLAYLVVVRGLRLPVARAALVAGLAYAALAHTRNQSLAGIIGTLLVAAPLGRLAGRDVEEGKGQTWFAIPLALAFILLRFALPVAHGDDTVTPATALAALDPAWRIRPVLNDYGFGPYLIFRGLRPFIDTRVELYGDDFLRRYARLMQAPPSPLSTALDQDGIDWTILRPGDAAVARLDRLPEWRRCYADAVAVVHVRRSEAASACRAAQPAMAAAVDAATADAPPREVVMDKDRVEGIANQAKGAVKEVAGKVTGDAKLEAEGKGQKAAGKVQNAAGGAKDALRDATKP